MKLSLTEAVERVQKSLAESLQMRKDAVEKEYEYYMSFVNEEDEEEIELLRKELDFAISVIQDYAEADHNEHIYNTIGFPPIKHNAVGVYRIEYIANDAEANEDERNKE